jgi:hypothetical protein
MSITLFHLLSASSSFEDVEREEREDKKETVWPTLAQCCAKSEHMAVPNLSA